MPTLLNSIEDKYVSDEDVERLYGFIVFVSNSPECKKGMFPPILALNDFDIDSIGETGKIKNNWVNFFSKIEILSCSNVRFQRNKCQPAVAHRRVGLDR